MKTIVVGGERYYTNPLACAWRRLKMQAWRAYYTARTRLWNAYARRKGYKTCDICDDTRGSAIGNGNVLTVEGERLVMCDFCTMDHHATPGFWKVQPNDYERGFV